MCAGQLSFAGGACVCCVWVERMAQEKEEKKKGKPCSKECPIISIKGRHKSPTGSQHSISDDPFACCILHAKGPRFLSLNHSISSTSHDSTSHHTAPHVDGAFVFQCCIGAIKKRGARPCKAMRQSSPVPFSLFHFCKNVALCTQSTAYKTNTL